MYCDRCDQKTPTETVSICIVLNDVNCITFATQQFCMFVHIQWSEMDECPTVLTLHLKRFDFDYNQMRYVKNSCTLDVPLSLDIEVQLNKIQIQK